MTYLPPEVTPSRENLRRSSRTIKRYSRAASESEDVDNPDSDQDFNLSDSDDDPDFNPVDKKVSRVIGSGKTLFYSICSRLARGENITMVATHDSIE